jgi:hypothetical protein
MKVHQQLADVLLRIAGSKVRVVRLTTPSGTKREPTHAGGSNLTLHQPVLNRLERADRAAKCLALLNVLEREINRTLCCARELGRERDAPPLPKAVAGTRQYACRVDLRALHEAAEWVGEYAIDLNNITGPDRNDSNIVSEVDECGPGNG